jgi:chlorite dismutase
MSSTTAKAINETIRYTLWTIFARGANSTSATKAGADELQNWSDSLAAQDITIRGMYDVSGMREDTDLMIWMHGPTAEGLQSALRSFRRTSIGSSTTMVWSIMALHREAEFNRSHVPAFMEGKAPKDWLCVYPFNRSYEWYLLPETERRGMLVEHGMKGRSFPDVLSNTVASFALNDFEWVLALESDQLHDLVDMMREMRYTGARRHVRDEVPFYTGKRINAQEVVELLQ